VNYSKIDLFLAWKIPCTLVQGASIKNVLIFLSVFIFTSQFGIEDRGKRGKKKDNS
jgi:hypothetical protein